MERFNILIVEDELNLCQAIERSITRFSQSCTVTHVSTVEAAETILGECNVGLIIADQTLCGFKTGLDLWKTCKVKCPHIPFVMISSMPVPDFMNEVHGEHQIPSFLPKPFSTHEFMEMIKKHFKERAPAFGMYQGACTVPKSLRGAA